ncbi:MAG: histidine kinase [Pedobacter sp.]|nr:histidine kinase [Pedobacter sp.]
MDTIDLTNCEQEPIHIPGKIQSHGFLIGIDQQYVITHCSDNVSKFLPVEPAIILGKSLSLLDSFIERADSGDLLIQLVKLSQTVEGLEPFNSYPLKISGKLFNVILSASDDYFLLDFEPEISSLDSDIRRIIGSSLSEMLADTNLNRLLANSAEQVKRIIGYDRVMIYKFHEDGHGEVVSEVSEPGLDPFFGLHYPASDIPRQARELYKVNLTRLIADVTTEPAALVCYGDAESTLDLTNSGLRAVSPVHIQYLKNMGVASSFSLSLLHQNELWGLVACHNYTPRFINYRQRDAAKLIGQVLSSALSFRILEETKNKSGKFSAAVDALNKQLLRDTSIVEALLNHDTTLADAVEATGAVLIFENQYYLLGDTPPLAFIKELKLWLDDQNQEEPLQISNLSARFPSASKFAEKASGLLACRLTKELNEYLLWFRPEVISTVRWAGNPNKPVELSSEGTLGISPRKSFATWLQTVEHTAEAWRDEDLESVIQLREGISYAISRKASELRLLNERLKVAYDELDAFSYTISHDLKNPLASIKSYAQLLPRKFDLEPDAKHMVGRILNAADRMQNMITEVLNYSQVGQSVTNWNTVNMHALLDELRLELMISSHQDHLQINIGHVEEIHGDQTMVQQVFSNLLGNAVKYSGKSENPRVDVCAQDLGYAIQYVVTDNGIGIDHADQAKIFDLFSRSGKVSDFEGSGVGLSIVKKIMEKHEGKIWVESNGENGSAFYVQFKKLT